MRLQLCSCLLVLINASVLANTAADFGIVRGTVLSEGSRDPIRGASACLRELRLCAGAGSTGAFTLDAVPPGSYTLDVRADGYLPTSAKAMIVEAGRDVSVEVVLSSALSSPQRLDVSATPGDVESATSQWAVTTEQIRRSAGALGDVVRYVTNRPGATFANDRRGDIVARGGNPSENLFLFDRVEVPNVYHFATVNSTGGFVSMINTEMMSDIRFLTGGYGAEYSGRLSSVLEMVQREGARDRIHKYVDAGYAGAGVVLEGPLGEKASWIASARRSFVDVFGVKAGSGGSPVYSNAQGKLVYNLNPSNRLILVNLSGFDTIRFRPTPDDVNEPETNEVDESTWRSASGLTWQSALTGHAFSWFTVSYSQSRDSQDTRDTLLAGATVRALRLRESQITIKQDLTLEIARWLRLQAGYNFKNYRSYYDIRQPIGFQSPFSAHPGRVEVIGIREHLNEWGEAGYLQWAGTAAGRITLTAGARLERMPITGFARVSPRAGVSYTVSKRLTLKGSYGRYAQQPYMAYFVTDPANRRLSPIRATHQVVGLDLAPSAGIRLSVEAFRKSYADYPVSLAYPSFSLANVGVAIGLESLAFAMGSAGRGNAIGIELAFEKRLLRQFHSQFSYALSKTEYSGLDGVMRPGSYDHRHSANLLAGYRPNDRWNVSARAAWLSGAPYTPFLLPESLSQNRGIFDLSRVNAVRASDYLRLDFRIDHHWRLKHGGLTAYAGVINLLDRRNALFYRWDAYRNRPFEEKNFSRMPDAGIEWRF